jgi:hypothetical protein
MQPMSRGQKPISCTVLSINSNEFLYLFFNYRAQSSLPTVIKNFCEAMSVRTGWSFSVLTGGPDPAANGTIRTIGIHVGQNTYGHSFGRAMPDFLETYMKPYSTFLHGVYRTLSQAKILH